MRCAQRSLGSLGSAVPLIQFAHGCSPGSGTKPLAGCKVLARAVCVLHTQHHVMTSKDVRSARVLARRHCVGEAPPILLRGVRESVRLHESAIGACRVLPVTARLEKHMRRSCTAGGVPPGLSAEVSTTQSAGLRSSEDGRLCVRR